MAMKAQRSYGLSAGYRRASVTPVPPSARTTTLTISPVVTQAKGAKSYGLSAGYLAASKGRSPREVLSSPVAVVATAAAQVTQAKGAKSYGLSAGYLAASKGRSAAAVASPTTATIYQPSPSSRAVAVVTIQKSFPVKIAKISFGISEGYRRSRGVIVRRDAFASQLATVATVPIVVATEAVVVLPPAAVPRKTVTYGLSEGYKRMRSSPAATLASTRGSGSSQSKMVNPLLTLVKTDMFARAVASIQKILRVLIVSAMRPLLDLRRTLAK